MHDRPFDALYVSPHPDDAIFSAGGTIALEARSARRVAVVTLFSRGAADEPLRRDEDAAAVARLGAARIDLGLPEAPARDPAYRRPSRLFAPLAERDRPLVEEVRAAIERIRDGAEVIGPLGVGRHVDHQIAHAACASLPGRVAFYDDIPYALCPGGVDRRLIELGVAPANARLRPAGTWALARWWAGRPLLRETAPPPFVPLAALLVARAGSRPSSPPAAPMRLVEERQDVSAATDDKLAAIADYASQWPRFFPTLSAWRAALAGHARALGSPVVVERRWRRV